MESHASKAYYSHFNSPRRPVPHISRLGQQQGSSCQASGSLLLHLPSPLDPLVERERKKEREEEQVDENLDGEESKTSLTCPLFVAIVLSRAFTITRLHPPPSSLVDPAVSSSTSMAARRPPAAVLLLVMWITLLLLLLHGWNQLWRSSSTGVAGTAADHGSLSGSAGRATPRKMLSSRFDFSPFGVHHSGHSHHRHHRHRHGHHSSLAGEVNRQPSGAGEGDEIDPRYGVEKRLVPTGPNPLHH